MPVSCLQRVAWTAVKAAETPRFGDPGCKFHDHSFEAVSQLRIGHSKTVGCDLRSAPQDLSGRTIRRFSL